MSILIMHALIHKTSKQWKTQLDVDTFVYYMLSMNCELKKNRHNLSLKVSPSHFLFTKAGLSGFFSKIISKICWHFWSHSKTLMLSGPWLSEKQANTFPDKNLVANRKAKCGVTTTAPDQNHPRKVSPTPKHRRRNTFKTLMSQNTGKIKHNEHI